MQTRDSDIRAELHNKIKEIFSYDLDSIVVEEMNLCSGDARIDIAVINGKIHGYEIKSERDTLNRLPNQIDIYNQVMDTVTIVVGRNHLGKVRNMVPNWWGIYTAEMKNNTELKLEIEREPLFNEEVNPYYVAQLLWRDEALEILKEINCAKGVLSKPRDIIWERLVNSLSLEELQKHVRNKLKNRKGWRAVPLQR